MEAKKTIFEEKQYFRQIWLWIMVLAVNGVFLYGLFRQLVQKQEFGNKPMSDLALIMLNLFNLTLTCFLLFVRLETKITEEGVYYRYYPLQHFRKIIWGRIGQAYVRRYSPLREFGGWGLRIGWKKGMAYNVSGNQGLQLVYDQGRHLLLGTARPGELEAVLKKLDRWKPADDRDK